MKKIVRFLAIPVIMISFLTLHSCKKDPKPKPVEEQEEYDDVRVSFIELNADGSPTTDTTSVSFDRQGVPKPSHQHLKPHTQYRLLINMFYKATNINGEITDAGTEHQFFFIPSAPEGIEDYTYSDKDANNRGIGLDGLMKIGEGEFDLKIVLRHGLNKAHPSAQAFNSATYHDAGGEDDLNISFEVHAEE